MNPEILEILGYIEYDPSGEIGYWREVIQNMDAAAFPETAQEIVEVLDEIINGRILESQYHLGYYHLFFGCAAHEISDYENAIFHFARFLAEAKGSCVNEAMARWLLSVTYLQAGAANQAQASLEQALNVIKNNPSMKRDRERSKFFLGRIQEALTNPRFYHFVSASSQFSRSSVRERFDNVVNSVFRSRAPESPEPESTPPQETSAPPPPPIDTTRMQSAGGAPEENNKRSKIHITVPLELDIDVGAQNTQTGSEGNA